MFNSFVDVIFTKNQKEMKFDKKIWVKKTYSVSGNRYTQIYSRDFYPVKKNRRVATDDSNGELPHYTKAPFWYPGYRYLKANFVRGLFRLVTIIAIILVVVIVTRNMPAIRHFGSQLLEKIRR